MKSLISTLIAAVLGILLGYVLSYWLQPGVLRLALSLGDYVGEFAPKELSHALSGKECNTQVVRTILLGMGIGVFCTVLGSSLLRRRRLRAQDQ